MAKKKMKAAVIHDFGSFENIVIQDIDIPQPKQDEVQIEVYSAGVNPVDWKICEGAFKGRMKHEFPVTLGWDVAGVVSQVGNNVKNVREGDPVFAYCRQDVIHSGSFAEYICLNSKNVVLKPNKLTYPQAASIPLASLTAWQSLYDTAHLKKNEFVLIHGGSGGVGTFAIQFAKIKGAKVITTTSKKHYDYVKQLGADTIVDYTDKDYTEKLMSSLPEGADVVYDCVGGNTLNASYSITKLGGRLVTIAGVIDKALADQRQIEANYVLVRPDGKELAEIAHLIENGKVQVPEIKEYKFDDVLKALREIHEGHTQGKIVLDLKA